MAVVRPYADPNARGPLNKSICFRRYRNQVILQTFPNPTDRNSTDQQLQRNKLVQANRAYSLLKGATLFFYRQRGIQRRKTGKSLYMWANMNNRIPSINAPIFLKSIEEMIIYNPVGFQPDNVEFTIWNELPVPTFMLWNPLDEFDGAEMPSVNGPPGTVVSGLDTVPGKFDLGIQATAAGGGLEFPRSIIEDDQGFISWWMRTTEDVVDGVMENVTGDATIMSLKVPGGFQAWFIGSGGTPGELHFITPWATPSFGGDTRLTWNAGEWVHMTMAWDINQTEGWGNIIYFNGVEIWSTNIPSAGWPSGTDPYFALTVEFPSSPDWGKIILDDLLVSKEITNLQSVLDNFDNPGAQVTTIYGLIEDNRNEYLKLQSTTEFGTQFIRINTAGGNAINIPFRYLISVEWINQDDIIVHSVIRLPELRIPALSSIDLYLSRDWSVYWDEGLARLACTNTI